MTSDFTNEASFGVDENDVDVVIVGAGLTGLVCAYDILRRNAGLDVLIIEANKEVGGRLLSRDCNRSFHANVLQKRFTRLLNVLRMKIHPRRNVDGKRRVLYARKGTTRNFPRFHGAEVYNFLKVMEESTSDPRFNSYGGHEDAEVLAEISVEKLLRRLVYIPHSRSLCRAFVCSTCSAGNLNDVSALWLLVLLNGAGGFLNRLRVAIGDDNRYFVQGGMTRVAQELLKQILHQNGYVRYAETVNRIQYNDDRAYVSTDKNRFKCNFVVLAIPPPAHDRIVIEPPQDSSQPRSLYVPARNTFFNIVYNLPFWHDRFTGDILTTWGSDTNLSLSYDASYDRKFVLAGFLKEPNSSHTSKRGLLETLDECFESADATNYDKYEEYNAIRYSFLENVEEAGSPMSVMKPSKLFNHVRRTGVSRDRVFFASSEYAADWPGTVDGAIEAGEITAYSILSRMRPQALTSREITTSMLKRGQRPTYAPFEVVVTQYLGLLINIVIFLSFLRSAYDDVQ